MYIVIWEYEVHEDHLRDFLKSYGKDGVWYKFFQRDDNYLGTDLYRKTGTSIKFVTIDKWVNEIAYLKFKEEYRKEYERIDERFKEITLSEVFIGGFQQIE